MFTPTVSDYRRPRAVALLAAFLLVVIVVGGAICVSTAPGAWYAGLTKPPFNPPNWIFAPVWFALYVLIAVAGWCTFLADQASPRMRLWYAQMLLNWPGRLCSLPCRCCGPPWSSSARCGSPSLPLSR